MTDDQAASVAEITIEHLCLAPMTMIRCATLNLRPAKLLPDTERAMRRDAISPEFSAVANWRRAA